VSISSKISCCALLLIAAATSAAAQAPARVHVGAGLGIDLLVGDASDFLDGGGSRYLQADFRVTASDRLHVRVDGASTGLEDDEDEGTGIVAKNDVVVLVAGPQVSLPLGRFRPYAGLVGGLAAVAWETEGSFGGGDVDDDGVEATFAWGGHAGLGFTVSEGDHPVAFRVEARLLDAGSADFARAPDFDDPGQPAGLIREDFALLGVRLGVTLGF
jgi:opacity protein-like surface antigen